MVYRQYSKLLIVTECAPILVMFILDTSDSACQVHNKTVQYLFYVRSTYYVTERLYTN